jgi:hypothetical protein
MSKFSDQFCIRFQRAFPLPILVAGCSFFSTGIQGNALAGDPASGWCIRTDMNGDRQRDSVDVDYFIAALLQQYLDFQGFCAGELTGDAMINGDDIQEFVRIWMSPDSDGDNIPNLFETNNGNFVGPTDTGTDPFNFDTDGDALSDGDEIFDTLAGLDLNDMGCSPLRKNICMEFDWFDDAEGGSPHTHFPNICSIVATINAFANAPVSNPYGGPGGITIIFDAGQDVNNPMGGPFTGGNLIPGGDTVVVFDSEFNAYKAANFAANRNGYFHYVIFCHRYNTGTNNSSGFAEIVGDDLIVSLQTFLSCSNVSKTLVHELGHNLGLLHGGFENRNFKPNYNSVMNYRYQFDGVDTTCDALGDGVLNYSSGVLSQLDETNLDENFGICGVPIDWNQDFIFSPGVQRNINCYFSFTYPCNTWDPNLCGDTICGTMMRDHNDWSSLIFTGISEADFARAGRQTISCQDTPQTPDK